MPKPRPRWELVEIDEAEADERDHWWTGHLVWRSDDASVVVCLADPDGYDLAFVGWGHGAADCLSAVETLLAGHLPDAP